jgi:hypothetical protein
MRGLGNAVSVISGLHHQALEIQVVQTEHPTKNFASFRRVVPGSFAPLVRCPI